jgi:triphosphoribosyl-dephospho-CoA synthase
MLSESDIYQAVLTACEQEVSAPKPGNVSPLSDGHGMQVQDFLNSAKAIAPVMARQHAGVGEKILASIQATREVVNCNTNLGIVLLFAPLCHAVRRVTRFEDLPVHLEEVLTSLTLKDAELCYEAIRMAEAGGLSTKSDQDIHSVPSVTLFEAMKIAQDYDQIAQQYVTGYQFIWQCALRTLNAALESGQNIEWATTLAYLTLLSEAHDSLICRKDSVEVAATVKEKATQFVFYMNKNSKIDTYLPQLTVWDTELKQKGLNPGSTADLVAATLLLVQFEARLSENRISVP